jgi:hypothetical protein
MLLISSCTGDGSPGEDAESVPSTPTSSTLVGIGDIPTDVVTSTDGAAPEENEVPQGPSSELLAAFFPVSGADLASVRYIAQSAENEQWRFLGSCFEAEGFTLDFESTVPPDLVPRIRLYPAYDSLRKYGFNMFGPPGLAPGLTYLEDIQNALADDAPLPEGISGGEANALLESAEHCFTQLKGEAQVGFYELQDTYSELRNNWSLLLDDLDRSDPGIVDAFEEFHACVTDRGWQLDLIAGDGSRITNDQPFFAAVDSLVLSEPDRESQRATEVQAASDYADCMMPVEDVRGPLRARLRDEYVDEYFADMVELESAFKDALTELGFGS